MKKISALVWVRPVAMSGFAGLFIRNGNRILGDGHVSCSPLRWVVA